ncbi:HipA family kinase [Microlunatus sp. GCM10028923]|uniref:HipA family kinase n=1 Tax=Microlunatus sp. GCM10028923 TaxID=3273400 RepID=UPI0036225123
MLPRITATAYLTPLREGGSLPAIMEADDLGTYVVKFTGAGQGIKALVAEIIVAGLARRADLHTPDLALIDVAAEVGRTEPDEEIQQLIKASVGVNLAVDYLPGSVGYDRNFDVDGQTASTLVWLDAWTANVDRSLRNTNLLVWHRQLWAIDHGACLRFHHAWGRPEAFAEGAYNYGDHVLSGRARPREAHDRLAGRFDDAALDAVIADVPDAWLLPDPDRPDPAAPPDPAAARIAYRDYLSARLAAAERWLR